MIDSNDFFGGVPGFKCMWERTFLQDPKFIGNISLPAKVVAPDDEAWLHASCQLVPSCWIQLLQHLRFDEYIPEQEPSHLCLQLRWQLLEHLRRRHHGLPTRPDIREIVLHSLSQSVCRTHATLYSLRVLESSNVPQLRVFLRPCRHERPCLDPSRCKAQLHLGNNWPSNGRESPVPVRKPLRTRPGINLHSGIHTH